ncbi:MAG: tetratricopeptide repeat protein [Anaerolineae bacterium]|nr:tetratricopeptide repeat protein [Anaerolineae bacterium]
MSGNREVYQRYMEEGHNAVWDQNWQAAIKAYTQAVREIAEDPEAYISLGLALLRAGRLEDAFKVYNRAHQLAPDDPVPLEKSADILERMGKLKEAAQQYIKVSEVYLALRDLDKAIGNWSRATQLTPGLVSIHAKLAQAYERVGDKRKAIREYLTLAFNYRRLNETDKAIKSVERALRLDKNNPQALNIMRALQSGGDVILPDDEEKSTKAKPRLDEDFDFGSTGEMERAKVGESDPLGPMGEAMDIALGLLANHVVSGDSTDLAVIGDAMQAMQYHRQQVFPEAVAAYQRAESRLKHPALQLNLGVLLALTDQPQEAVKRLSEALKEDKLSAGAMHGLGQAYFKLKKHKQASRYLIQSLQSVDSSLAVDENEEAELASVYSRLLSAVEDASDEAMNTVNTRFLKLLSGTDWKQRIAETRRHLDEMMRTGGAGAGLEFLVTSGSDELTEAVSRIDRFIRQGLLILAMDEAHRAVEYSPYYLPVHVRMAEVMMREGRVRQAINKYNYVARAYLVRDETERAASILSEVLEIAPMDIPSRTSLINLLEGEQRWDEALDQYVHLAKTYNQLGNFEMSRETYGIAERLAKKTNAVPVKLGTIKLAIAELDLLRADTARAKRIYEEIIELLPDDERAYRAVIDIYYTQHNHVEATRRLDQVLGIYAKNKQVSKIVQLLEEMVRNYPSDSGLRFRLARMYSNMGRNPEAIEQLDVLGNLQLEAGLHKDAINTIRQIIKLKPQNLNDYKRLLAQLGG